MSNEQNIIAACMSSRDAFETLQMHCSNSEFSPLGAHWIKQIGQYYARDKDAANVDRKLLRSMGLEVADERHAETLGGFLDDLPIVGISSENVVADILLHKRNSLGLKLASTLTNPDAPIDKVRDMVQDYDDLLVAASTGLSKLRVLDTSEVTRAYDPEKIIPLHPKQLRKQCLGGGALPGHHILIFGRPEAGKSLFAINMAAFMAYKGKRVVYYGNEESVKTHYIRMACNLALRNIKDFQNNAASVIAKAEQKGLQNVTFIELTPGTFAEIEQGIKEYKPDVVFVDQLAGIETGEANPVNSMDKAARSFRTLLLKHQIVGVSVSQAGDRTERHGQMPPAFLGMGDVYGSRTGIPAQVDLMLGIGFDQEMYDRDMRAVSIPKNKLGGSHNGFKVRIDKQQSRVISLS